jgi:hypothetical protein
MAYNEHLCHGVPLKKAALAQLLVNNTNTNKPKTPLVPLCHRLFFDRKKNLCPQYFTYVGTKPKTRIKLQLPCHCHNYFRMVLNSYQPDCFPCTYSQPSKLQVATLRSSLTSREMPLARFVRP